MTLYFCFLQSLVVEAYLVLLADADLDFKLKDSDLTFGAID